jgi:hypothetical protein
MTVPKYDQQWAEASPFYMFQTPENPRMVRMFDLLVEGEIGKALDIYWEMEPINEASMSMASVSYLRYRDNLCHDGQVLSLVQRRQRRYAEAAGNTDISAAERRNESGSESRRYHSARTR